VVWLDHHRKEAKKIIKGESNIFAAATAGFDSGILHIRFSIYYGTALTAAINLIHIEVNLVCGVIRRRFSSCFLHPLKHKQLL